MSARASAIVVVLALVGIPFLAAGQNFGFEQPVDADDETLPAKLRDLGERMLPVYQESDRERYLANVAALQMAIGDPAAARATRLSLRERQPRDAAGGQEIIDDIYVEARALESVERIPFAEAYARAFRQTMQGLDDLTAHELERRFTAPRDVLRENVQSVLDWQSDERSIALRDAIDLVQAWFDFEAARSYGPLVGPLLAEERGRRYFVEEVAIPVAAEATVAATLVRRRPRADGEEGLAQPTILEFALDRSQRDPYEAAAHGYASLLAVPRIAGEGAPRPPSPFAADGDDARAAIEWVARQPWSNGVVGMQGTRYGGFVAWSAAKQLPVALKAIATTDPMAPGIDVPNPNGIYASAAYRWAYELLAPPGDALAGDDARWREIEEEWYRSGRRYRDFPQLPGRASAVFRSWINHPSYDRFWQKWLPFRAEFASVDIPALTVTGYYSAGETGALHYFTEHREHHPNADHALLIGPFDERALADDASPLAGSSPFITVADLRRARYAWFDHVLKGAERPAVLREAVNYALAGASEWQHAPSLTALEGAPLRFYLASSPTGAPHQLAPEPGDPLSLTDTRNLRNRADIPAARAAGLVQTELPADSIGFVTEPFEEPTTVAGRLRGELDFTINKFDVDLVMMLYEVRADGAYVKLFEPPFAFRASYARDRVRRHLLQAGVRQRLPFQSERMMGRQLQVGSRLLLTIGVNLRPDQQINYGAGDDVSEESVEDAGATMRLRWHEGSFIEIPSHVATPPDAASQ
jgi:putative CocE/NonD family hydrolase